jgi:hypothetical protein
VSTNITTTTGLNYVNGEHIHFGGTGDRLQFIESTDDTITATGRNQAIAMIDSPGMTIVDHARGLTIAPEFGGFNMTVEDFQHDPTGRIFVTAGINPSTIHYTPDGHGGTVLSWAGPTSGGRVDFVGYADAAKLATHVNHF